MNANEVSQSTNVPHPFINLSQLTIGSKLSRLQQRVVDILLEKYVAKREVITRDLKSHRPRIATKVSFAEPQHFDKYGDWYTDKEARIVPYYTRAIEPIEHYLIPLMTKMGYSVVTTYHAQFQRADVHRENDQKPIASVLHESKTLALSVACLNAVVPRLDPSIANRIAQDIKK